MTGNCHQLWQSWTSPSQPTTPRSPDAAAHSPRFQVLTDSERTRANLEGDFWHHYDLFNIALAVIDQVALAMGISAGRTWGSP